MEESSLLAYWEVNNTISVIIPLTPRTWNKFYSPLYYRGKYFPLSVSYIIFSDINNSKIDSITNTGKLAFHFVVSNIVNDQI